MRLIDADEAIERIEKEIEREKAKIYEWEHNRKDREGYYDVDAKIKQYRRNITYCKADIAGLRSYPTINAEPVRHGKWVKKNESSRIIKCTECGREKIFKENYCPNCGAKMDGE